MSTLKVYFCYMLSFFQNIAPNTASKQTHYAPSSSSSSRSERPSFHMDISEQLDSKSGIFFAEPKKKHIKQLRIERQAYEKYLDSFVRIEDKRYLPNDRVMRKLAPLRAMVGTIVLSPSQFRHKHMRPLGSTFYFSEHNMTIDPLVSAISEREKLNSTKTLSVRYFYLSIILKLNLRNYLSKLDNHFCEHPRLQGLQCFWLH